MTLHRLTNWLLALAVVALYALVAHLDGPTDHSTEHTQALALKDAVQTAQAKERYLKAARALCGSENATATDLGDGTVQCFTKRGKKTVQVAL
jgi:hypothetical protein